MFRLETRYIILLFTIASWMVPIFFMVKQSYDFENIRQSENNLKIKLESVQDKLKQINSQLEKLVSEKTTLNREVRNPKLDPPASDSSISPQDLLENLNQLTESRLANSSPGKPKRILVTGGAGFVGSHLVDSLIEDGHHVIVCDNFSTGRMSNIAQWLKHPRFRLMNHDVTVPFHIDSDEIYHLASPASPVHYMPDPINTIKTNALGSINVLEIASKTKAKVLLASTSEVYGDPEVHPQSETYWGHVNPVGPRSCYDEGKRVSESLATAYKANRSLSISIARIFNTYGPRMHPNDGRVISNFVLQCLGNRSITVYGTGKQTRSFQYISDLIEGLKRLMASNISSPVNLGNPDEMTINALAIKIKSLTPHSSSGIVYHKLPIDDPHRRKPDIEKAQMLLNWTPKVDLTEGLLMTIDHFKRELESS